MSLWEVLAWHRPKVTSVLFGTVISVLALFCFMQYTVVTFLCRVIQLLLLLGVIVGLTNRCKLTSDDIHCAVNRFVDYATPRAEAALETTYNVVTWRNYHLSGMVTLASVVIAFLGNLFSDTALLVSVVVLAFSVPAVYERKKDLIDRWVGVAKSKVEKYMGTLKTKVEEVTKKDE
ncbi:reticulon domain protein [Trypanosoma conorhini]|uniref:Reticulon-like protein n=1 Tax=Trypanosoma conorhini TaxID=83891 RepID=A0A422P6V6_9TRYP|nr:reticulon domain protein [Trypanosoma conorhini]RNF13459.1 reticulon domain protein [Trypanosoma conorhini]